MQSHLCLCLILWGVFILDSSLLQQQHKHWLYEAPSTWGTFELRVLSISGFISSLYRPELSEYHPYASFSTRLPFMWDRKLLCEYGLSKGEFDRWRRLKQAESWNAHKLGHLTVFILFNIFFVNTFLHCITKQLPDSSRSHCSFFLLTTYYYQDFCTLLLFLKEQSIPMTLTSSSMCL